MRLFFLLSFLFILHYQDVQSQTHLLLEEKKTTEGARLRTKFRDFKLLQTDLRKGYESLANSLEPILQLEVAGGKTWSFQLQETNLLADAYFETIGTAKGKTKLRSRSIRTFSGKLHGRPGTISLTMDYDFFTASIQDGNQHWYIEPAGDFGESGSMEELILYNTQDILQDSGFSCGIEDTQQKAAELHPRYESGRTMANACKVIEIAIASDRSMYLKYGSVTAVFNRNIAIMNNVALLYRHEFVDNLEFRVLTQYVSQDPSADPLSSQPGYFAPADTTLVTNPSNALNFFRYWAELGGFNTFLYDIGQFWTNRDFQGTVVGQAFRGTACGSFKYHVLQDYTTNYANLIVMTAHEIGHNLNATHDTAPGDIMWQTISNTATWSALSKTDINGFIPSRSCLSACDAPALPAFVLSNPSTCIGNSIVFKDKTANGTTRTWDFPAGQPSTSTLPQPTVTYLEGGNYTVALYSSGAPALIEEDFIIVSDPDETPPVCAIPEGIPGKGGIRRFALNNMEFNSGTAESDDANYVDRFCTVSTDLEPGASYDVALTLGVTSPARTEWVRVYIDYNNDGIFNENEELVIDAPSAWAGEITFDPISRPWLRFTTPSTVIPHKMLRLRVITDENPITSACNAPTTGQVEDYAVFFREEFAAALPVDLISFSGKHEEQHNLITWTTVYESNLASYELLRSETGADFYPVALITAKASEEQRYTYLFQDNEIQATAGGYYYRLKMIDIDGSYTFSRIIYIQHPSQLAGLILQNCQTLITASTVDYELVSDTERNVTVTLIDRMGNTIRQWSRYLGKGTNTIQDELPPANAGIYFFMIQHTDEPAIVRKLVYSKL